MATHRICSIPDCGKPARTKGWCTSHYQRWSRLGDPLAGGPFQLNRPRRNAASDYLRDVVLPYQGDDCLIWPFYKDQKGYGRLNIEGIPRVVSQLSCEHAHGPRPSDAHHAAHSCGNSNCVNPNHIRWATAQENEGDKEAHGTKLRGETRPTSKLTEEAIRAIRSSEKGSPRIGLAEKYGVTPDTISRIRWGKTWEWLD